MKTCPGKFVLHYENNRHSKMASKKVWMTKDGEEIPYRKLTDEHLVSILNMLETQKTNRASHLQGIREERARRATILGKILYGTKV